MNRKVATILLSMSLLAPLVATFTVLHYQKYWVRKEVKRKLIARTDKSELVLFQFTKEQSENELRWEHSKEFEYNGQMYDVVEKEQHGGTTYYWCWWDSEETRLNRMLDELVANVWGNNPQRNGQQIKLIDFFKKLYYNNVKSPLSLPQLTLLHAHSYHNHYTTVQYAPPKPPPRLS